MNDSNMTNDDDNNNNIINNNWTVNNLKLTLIKPIKIELDNNNNKK